MEDLNLYLVFGATIGGLAIGLLATRLMRPRGADPDALKEQLFKVRTELEEQLRRSESLPGMLSLLGTIQEADKLYESLTRMSREHLSSDFAALFLKQGNEFVIVSAEALSLETRENLRLPAKSGLVQYLVETARPVRIGRGDRQLTLFQKHREDVNEVMLAPLRTGREVFGIIFLGRQSAGPFWTGSDLNLLGFMAIPFSLAAHNMVLNSNYQKTVLQALTEIASEIEERDPYFAGHSQRVAQLCLLAGQELRMSERDLEALEVAARLHDLGTIAVPIGIIDKEGKLSEAEMAEVKEHPKRALELLQPLGFLDRSLPMILYHHERYDGNGYPYGL
ncbi:MAG: HD domain-containing phosphohydrolase, partial [Candidatus Eremiobacterota bacterium]